LARYSSWFPLIANKVNMDDLDHYLKQALGLSAIELLALSENLQNQGVSDEVLELIYRGWLSSNANADNSHLAWYQFGVTLSRLRQWERAESSFKASLEKSPNFYYAILGLGLVLEAQSRLDDSIRVLQSILQPRDFQIQVLNNLARINDGLHKNEEVLQNLADSILLNEDQPDVISTALMTRQRLCFWPLADKSVGLSADNLMQHMGPLSSLSLFDDPEVNKQSVLRFVSRKGYNTKVPQLKARFGGGSDKLRVGFMSADIRLHATSVFFAPLLERLNREQFEVIILDLTTTPDLFNAGKMRNRLLGAADEHLQLQGLSDEDAAKLIHGNNIDVVVDMACLTAGSRPGILAYRPASINMSYLGYIGASGLDYMDYVITTPDISPAEFAYGHTESPVLLEGSYIAIDERIDESPSSFTRASFGIPDNAFVFCAAMNSYKITEEVFTAWMEILSGVKDGVLLLVEESETMKNNLLKQASICGIGAERLFFMKKMEPQFYKAYLKLADLFLDTFPYGNGATLRDCVLVGLPTLTRRGKTMMSRLSAHIMGALNLSDLVVDALDDYKNLAIELAHNRDRLRGYKKVLIDSQENSPLFNVDEFSKNFGNLILEVWEAKLSTKSALGRVKKHKEIAYTDIN